MPRTDCFTVAPPISASPRVGLDWTSRTFAPALWTPRATAPIAISVISSELNELSRL
jgi:hypothetical protein